MEEDKIAKIEQNESDAEEVKDADFAADATDSFVGLDQYAERQEEESDLTADEIGVSGVYDAYKREIIPNVFENRLRQSVNAVKLAYSKLKNAILSYSGVRRAYAGKSERFTYNGELMFRFEIEDGMLKVTYDGDKTLFVKKEKGGEALKQALEVVKTVAQKGKWKPIPSFAPTAYAERYPYNCDAVLQGEEDVPPDDAFKGEEYDPIENELTRNIIEEWMSEDFNLEEKQGQEKLDALRQQATTIKGAVALTEPIVYFYNVARDNENNVAYVCVQQVLNDKFLGKMLPQQFFAIAEQSERIHTLNLWCVQEAVKACNENPTLTFVTQASARLLLNKQMLERLKKAVVTENNNLVLAFDCALLEDIGEKSLIALRELATTGVKMMIDNTESAGLRVLTEYPIDYLRFDGRYYKEENERKAAHLDMILGYAKVQGIKTSALYVDTVKQAKFLLSHGVESLEGDVVGTPVRLVHNAVKEAKKLPVVGK